MLFEEKNVERFVRKRILSIWCEHKKKKGTLKQKGLDINDN